jgi:hypothetical protein
MPDWSWDHDDPPPRSPSDLWPFLRHSESALSSEPETPDDGELRSSGSF